jgi:hypothetical protein
MSGLFGKPANSATQEVYAGIQVGTSVYGSCIPYVAGRQRIPFNLLWYANFKATQGSSGGNKGGGGGSGSYNYSAAWLASLCIGPITGVNQIWHDKALETLTSEGLTLSLGASGPAIWSPLSTYTPPGAAFDGYIAGLTLVVTTLTSGQLLQGQTITSGAAAGTKITSVGSTGGGLGSYQVSISQTVGSVGSPVAMVTSMGVTGGQAIPYDHQAWVASPGYNLGGSASMPNLNFEVDGVVAGFSIANGMYDADPAAIVPDYLQNPVHGAGFQGTIATLTGLTNSYQAYCMCMGLQISPIEDTQRQASDYISEVMQITNSDVVLSAGVLRVLPYYDSPTTLTATTPDGSNWSYTPNLTPLYVLTDANYCPDAGEAPVKFVRKALSETYNLVQVEYLDRLNYYNEAPAGAQDNNDIAQYGPRVMSTLTFHQVTNAQTAQTVAQLLMQASLYERNTYEFKLPFVFGLLEAGDYVSLNDANLGLVNQLVRILEIADDGSNKLSLKAMEVTGVTRATPLYNWNGAQGFAANYNAPPGNISAPQIFQMPAIPASLSEGITIGIAACGLTSSTAWQGCIVSMSIDGGTTYAPMGRIGGNGPGRYGLTTATLAAVTPNPDTTSTLDLTLADTNLQLDTSVTNANAQNGDTLLLVDTGTNAEVMAYGAGTLTGPGAYALTYLYRGLYGSNSVAHASDVPVVRLDGGIFQIPVDPGYAGQTLYFKFQSINTTGTVTQALSAVTAYSYTVPNANAVSGVATLIPRGACTLNAQSVYKSTTAASAWDSDCVSTASYSSVSVSAQYSAGDAVGVGLATSTGSTMNPGTLTNYYAIYANSAAPNVWVYAGTTILYASGAAPSKNDLYQVTYDGFTIRFYINGALVATQPLQSAQMYIGLAEYQPGSVLSNVQTTVGALATPSQFVATGNAVVNNTNAMKQGGTTAWDCAVYSVIGYDTCHITAKVNQVSGSPTANCMIALSTQPVPTAANISAGTVYVQANYAFYNDGNAWLIYESGTSVATLSNAPALTDVVAITYDGSIVTYYMNGVSVRTVSASSLFLTGFVPLCIAGAGVNTLRFGPTTNLSVIDTPQVGANAVSQVISATSTSFSVGLLPASPSATVISASGTFTGAPVGIDFSGQMLCTFKNASPVSPTQIVIQRDGTTIGIADVDVYAIVNNTEPAVALGGTQQWSFSASLIVNDTPAAGTHTYAAYLNATQAATSGGGPFTAGISSPGVVLKVREYKK